MLITNDAAIMYQAVQFRLAKMASDLNASRQAVRFAARQLDAKSPYVHERRMLMLMMMVVVVVMMMTMVMMIKKMMMMMMMMMMRKRSWT